MSTLSQPWNEPAGAGRRGDALLSIVLPVFNEAGVLDELTQRVSAAADQCGLPYEIVFVNDGSSDDSGTRLDELTAANPRIRVLHFSRNFGHQAAVHAGLTHSRGDAVVLMDSDLQDDPAAIARFVQAWQQGSDVVYAVRTERKEAAWKRCLFSGFHRLLAAISDTAIPADAGNFSLMDRKVVDRIVELAERDRYLPGLRSWVGFRQIGLPVERLARYDERPRVSLRGLWRLAKTAVFSFSRFPLSVFYFIGCAAFGLFLGLAGYSLYCRLFTELAIPGWTSQLLTATFFGALNALGISILGEYVVRIYDQVRGRPIYVIDRRVNCRGESLHHALPLSLDRPADELSELDAEALQSLVREAEQLLEAARPMATCVTRIPGTTEPTALAAGNVAKTARGD